MKNKKQIIKKLEAKNVLLILGVIYTLITILAVVSYISYMKKISTTPVTFSSVLGSILWQIIMITLFASDYIIYSKKKTLGALIETIMGIAMLVYMVVSIALIGANFFAILIELIYPLILVFHGLITFKKYVKKNKK